ncbi:MAG: hypothetical protein K9N35_04900 [Candidatus Marinimicrobia bacterium]|nr:hypothetical protein [Candidatus Neomarinimicrobiota bacterium]
MKLIPLALSLILILFLVACEQPSGNAPADHTGINGGVAHKPGFNDPMKNCVSCHGSDLRGGSAGVSCFACHAKKWS